MRTKRLFALGLAAILMAGTAMSVSADKLEELQAEQARYEEEQAQTQQQLDEINGQLDELEEAKEIVLEEIDETDAELVITIAAINNLTAQIKEKTKQLAKTSQELIAAEEDQAVEYDAMKKRIRYLYEEGGNAGWMTLLIEDKNLTDVLNQAEYAQKMYSYDRECLEHYAEIVAQVTALKEQQTREKNELNLMKKNQEEQKAHLEEVLEELSLENENYDTQIGQANKLAAEYGELIREQNAKIQELIDAQEAERARIAAEEEARRRAAEEAARQAAAEEAARQAAAAQQAASYSSASSSSSSSSSSSYTETPSYAGDSIPSYGGGSVVDRAYAWLGRAEYVWAACSPGAFDCSGFVSYCLTGAYARLGTTYTFLTWPRVSNPQPGDVCVNAQHCGIYIGNGQMIHCATYGVGVIIGPVQAGMVYVRY